MKKWLLIATATTLLHHAAAQSDMATFFSKLTDFQADFSQTVKQDGKIVQQSNGKVWLKKPLKFHWDYQTPEKMVLVSNGRQFYHYDVGLAQVTVKPVEEVTNSALTTLLNDREQLDDLFAVQPMDIATVRKRYPKYAATWVKKADFFYALTPKQKNADNQATNVVIGLTLARKLGIFYAKDAFGENVFSFSKIKQNQQISNKKFTFKAPKGVDVLGQ